MHEEKVNPEAKKYYKRETDKNINDLHNKFDKLTSVLLGNINDIENIGIIPRIIENEKILINHIEQHEKTKSLLYRWVLGGGFGTAVLSIFSNHTDKIKDWWAK